MLKLSANKTELYRKQRVVGRLGDGDLTTIDIYLLQEDGYSPYILTDDMFLTFKGNLANGEYTEGPIIVQNRQEGFCQYTFSKENFSATKQYKRAYIELFDASGAITTFQDFQVDVIPNADLSKGQVQLYVSKLDTLLKEFSESYNQFVLEKESSFQGFLEEKELQYQEIYSQYNDLVRRLNESDQRMGSIEKDQDTIIRLISENNVATKNDLEQVKQESSANVIDQIGGAESAILKKEFLVDGTEGTASRYVKGLSAKENLLGVFKNSRWKIDNDTGRVTINGVSNGSTLSEVTLPTGEYTVSFKVFDKSTTATSLSLYIDGTVDNAGSLTNIQGYNTGQLITKKIVLTKESLVKYTLWGNSQSDSLSFEMKLEKGEYSQYSLAPEWVGIVHGQPNLLDGTSNDWVDYKFSGWDDGVNFPIVMSDVGLKAGDTITFSAEMNNKSGSNAATTKLFVNKDAENLLQKSGNPISVGSTGISSLTVTIPEGANKLFWYKVSKGGNTVESVIAARGHKLIKGSLAAMDEWTPSQSDSGLTPINGGMVPFTADDYTTLQSKDGIVKAETLEVGRGAEIQFDFDVIGTLEKRYPYLFADCTTMIQKINRVISKSNSIHLIYTARVKDIGTGAISLFIKAVNGNFVGIVADGATDFKTFDKTHSMFKTNIGNDGIQSYKLETHQKSNGVDSVWIEVKDIRLVIELEGNASEIIDYRIAQYSGKNSVSLSEPQNVEGLKNFSDGIQSKGIDVATQDMTKVTLFQSTELSNVKGTGAGIVWPIDETAIVFGGVGAHARRGGTSEPGTIYFNEAGQYLIELLWFVNSGTATRKYVYMDWIKHGTTDLLFRSGIGKINGFSYTSSVPGGGIITMGKDEGVDILLKTNVEDLIAGVRIYYIKITKIG